MRVKFGRASAVVLVVSSVAVAFVGGGAWGANPFTDISGNSHANNIDAIFNAGITLGCSTTDPTRYCPADVVRRDQMASFLARLGGLNGGTSKNFPRANARSDIQSFCSAAKLSPRSFAGAPCQLMTRTLDAAGTTNPSITLDVDGRPILSYFDGSNGDLKFARCTMASCSAAVTRAVAFPASTTVGDHSSIQVGADGLPIISYYDATATDLYMAQCGDLNCTSASVVPIAVSDLDYGKFSSLAIGGDGLPVMSYLNDTDNFIRIAHCQNSLCTGTIDAQFVAATAPTGAAMAINSDGLPVLAYIDQAADLKVIRCTAFTCATRTTTTIDDTGTSAGRPSVAIGADGFPLIAYHDGLSLKVAHCTSVDCAVSQVVTAVAGTTSTGGTNVVGLESSVGIGTNGFPVIAITTRNSVSNTPNQSLVRCRDIACASATTTPGPFLGADPAIVIGPDGHATVAYSDADASLLGANRLKTYREVVS